MPRTFYTLLMSWGVGFRPIISFSIFSMSPVSSISSIFRVPVCCSGYYVVDTSTHDLVIGPSPDAIQVTVILAVLVVGDRLILNRLL